MAVNARGETGHLLPTLQYQGIALNKQKHSLLCVIPTRASYQSQSCPSCQRRAWTRLSGRQCPRNTRSGCSSSEWPEWRQWQTHSLEFLPAAKRTKKRKSEDTLRSTYPLTWSRAGSSVRNCHPHTQIQRVCERHWLSKAAANQSASFRWPSLSREVPGSLVPCWVPGKHFAMLPSSPSGVC